MKKILFLILFLVIIFSISCEIPAIKLRREKMLEIYSDDDNYETLTGEVIRFGFYNAGYPVLVIKDDSNKWGEIYYYVYGLDLEEIDNIDIKKGDIIEYVAAKKTVRPHENPPVVSIVKNDVVILSFEDGKKELLNSAYNLKYK